METLLSISNDLVDGLFLLEGKSEQDSNIIDALRVRAQEMNKILRDLMDKFKK